MKAHKRRKSVLWVRTFPVLCTIFGHSFIVCAAAPPLASWCGGGGSLGFCLFCGHSSVTRSFVWDLSDDDDDDTYHVWQKRERSRSRVARLVSLSFDQIQRWWVGGWNGREIGEIVNGGASWIEKWNWIRISEWWYFETEAVDLKKTWSSSLASQVDKVVDGLELIERKWRVICGIFHFFQIGHQLCKFFSFIAGHLELF